MASGGSHGAVALDAAPVRSDPTGVGVYVRDLARALHELAPERIRLIGARAGGPLDDLADGHRIDATTPHAAWLARHADRASVACGARLAHWTNAVGPARQGLPSVVTIQDLSVLRQPRAHPPRRLLLAPLMALTAHRAAAVIVPSRATARELRRVLRVPERRIVVVPHAPSATLRAPEPAVGEAVRARFGLHGRYLASVGTLEPRKNHVRLTAAFERLAAQDPELRLVLVGGAGWHGRALEAALARSPAADRIVRTGYVTDAEVAALVGGAAAFVYPSLYEGFGLPVVEAMALGVPVVTSDRSSLPEAAGGAAVLVDPRDPGAIARGIERALAERSRLVAAGRQRAASRGWRDVAGETLEVYDHVLAGRGR